MKLKADSLKKSQQNQSLSNKPLAGLTKKKVTGNKTNIRGYCY